MQQLTAGAQDAQTKTLEHALREIAGRAPDLDSNPRFPTANLAALKAAGVTQLAAERELCGLCTEIALVRALAGADASSARILDGHFNGVERVALCAPPELREAELERVRSGTLLLGVWGADPASGEGPPAHIEHSGHDRPTLRGVKTFCSGAGGVQRALVIARDEHGARRLAYADVTESVTIDRSWYRASGLRSSESHRVEFDDTPILAVLGGEDELMREPWLSRDSVRTSATWAGLADCILAATLAALDRVELDDVRLHGIGRMRVAVSTIDRSLEHAATRLDDGERIAAADAADGPRALAGECRVAIAGAARLIAEEAARVCGSRALVGGGTLDRARRDLDLFLLQHRLDPKLVEIGARTVRESLR